MKRVYVSLPITGREKQAREKADLVKGMLSRAGYEAVNPFEIYAGKNPEYEDYICYDLRVLLKCDAIYLCEGWQFSKGCQLEAEAARIYGKEIIYERQGAANGSEYYFNR